MERFKFINEADLAPGKITSRRVRKAIRTHVIRQHCATVTGAGHQSMVQPSAEPEKKTNNSRLPKSNQGQKALRQEESTSNEHKGSEFFRNNLSTDEASAEPNRPEIIEEPSRHLNRVTDAFICAGSNIDSRSYSFFNHYLSECLYHLSCC